MGLKENFAQAVKELTGAGKDEPKKSADNGVQDGLKRAVNAVSDEERPADIMAAANMSDATNSANSENEANKANAENAAGKRETPEEFNINLGAPAQKQFGNTQEIDIPKEFVNASASDNGGNASEKNTDDGESNRANINSTPRSEEARSKANSFADFMGNSAPQSERKAAPAATFSTSARDTYDSNELTIISKNTVIDGNVRSFANMSIDGDIKGDVETTKNIELNGKIVGNVTCNNAAMRSSQIQGNVRMKGNVEMERDTLLIGDLVSTYANLNGKVKGNLDIAGKAELKSDSVIFGDISASTITVDDGAIIQGYVSTTFLNKDESRNIFPDAISIGE